jgi:hypothetical protein
MKTTFLAALAAIALCSVPAPPVQAQTRTIYKVGECATTTWMDHTTSRCAIYDQEPFYTLAACQQRLGHWRSEFIKNAASAPTFHPKFACFSESVPTWVPAGG